MSIKSSIQIIIFLLIILIVGSVYYKYFNINKNLIEEFKSSEINNKDQIKELEKKIINLELKNSQLNNKIENNITIPKKNFEKNEIEKNLNLEVSNEKNKKLIKTKKK